MRRHAAPLALVSLLTIACGGAPANGPETNEAADTTGSADPSGDVVERASEAPSAYDQEGWRDTVAPMTEGARTEAGCRAPTEDDCRACRDASGTCRAWSGPAPGSDAVRPWYNETGGSCPDDAPACDPCAERLEREIRDRTPPADCDCRWAPTRGDVCYSPGSCACYCRAYRGAAASCTHLGLADMAAHRLQVVPAGTTPAEPPPTAMRRRYAVLAEAARTGCSRMWPAEDELRFTLTADGEGTARVAGLDERAALRDCLAALPASVALLEASDGPLELRLAPAHLLR